MNTYKIVLNTIVEPIAEHDEVYLRGWVSRLKQEGGEGWAVGEMLERAMRYISMTLALAEEASQCPEPAPSSLMTSVKKVKAGLRHAGSQEFQDYPTGIVELGTALDAIDMLANDVTRMLEVRHLLRRAAIAQEKKQLPYPLRKK